MRALHLISSGGVYGAERMLINLVRALKGLGCLPTIGVLRNERNPHTEVADILREEGCRVLVIPCRNRWDSSAFRMIRDTVRDLHVDIVHTHGYKADIYGFLATRNTRTPVVATCHNWTRSNSLLTSYSLLDRWVLRYFHKLAAVSDDLADQLRNGRAHDNRVVTIANGVPVSEYATASPTIKAELGKPGHLIVGTVARMVSQKGIPILLESARRILRSFPETTFVLVGEGPEQAQFRRLAESYGIASSVRFVGWRDDMPGVYRSFDIFVLASLKEGMPMSILEAMAAGVPVIATPVGDVRKAVRDGQTGLLIEPGDSGALETSIARLLSDPLLRARMGREAQQWVQEHYSADTMARRYVGLYEEAFAAHA